MSMERFIGIDVGAETVKVAELTRSEGTLHFSRRWVREHHKEPGPVLLDILRQVQWTDVAGAAASGRLSRQVNLPRVPIKQAQAAGYRFLFSDETATLVSIGSHGFSVLELRPRGVEIFRENSRCSQGTGNFLRQLVERFDLTIQDASELCADVSDPAPLSGRCPVILKTDMTHLANKGEGRARILAGLYDAVCENVQVLVKPRVSPPKVLLLGGVCQARRIREHFRAFLGRHDMALDITDGDDALFFEALGSAVVAARTPEPPPPLEQLLASLDAAHLERLPALGGFLGQVRRMPREPLPAPGGPSRRLLLGFDIGSTGSKAVALDMDRTEVVWEGYLNTNGSPVAAAQALMRLFVESPWSEQSVLGVGATGSGREIVGSLLSICYGPERVYIKNEIAAHAEGALRYDPRVDTIFEIGGQDAKYIRLSDGRVVDAAMNEACSAGTGSFIEEQGRKFSGIRDVVQLGEQALMADHGISLGQHCSVFMAEIIDEAVAAGEPQPAIIAGIYDSIIQNYLNRVKGSRSVGQVIFCQGMPFSSDALAAAVASQTGSEVIIPPNPGTVGALGIALLAQKGLGLTDAKPVDPAQFLGAEVLRKDTFVCKATSGCGGSGNKCRIDRLHTRVEGEKRRFTWGGGCSLWDRGTGKVKLPDLAPDPFRRREELVAEIVNRLCEPRGRPTVALTDEFMLKSLFPFFAKFVHALGFDLRWRSGAGQQALKRGIEEANVPFCAPMQQYHGLVSAMAEEKPDFLFLPMLRSLPRVGGEPMSKVCPIVQGATDMLCWDLGPDLAPKVVRTVIDFGPESLESRKFIESCQRLAADLGVPGPAWKQAYSEALAVQTRFDAACMELGRQALAYSEQRGLIPVVVLGRAYTIYNQVLNSNVPAILREQGAIAIPVDCYPLGDDIPVFHDMYWGYGQRNLRAAHQIRRQSSVYSIFCSNYSCGPDSFVIHFYSYIMAGKPYSVIETDGHSGDAGTKTRVEAFLHCVQQDLTSRRAASRPPAELRQVELDTTHLAEVRRRGERILIPRMGPGAEAMAACLRGIGIPAESLPMPNREAVRLGRRQTSGKECVPMTITIGSLLQRMEQAAGKDERFCLLMPRSQGPCRFGMYNILHKIIMERLDLRDRVRVWSPADTAYFDDLPQGFVVLLFCALMTTDMLLEALYHARPAERVKGEAQACFDHAKAELIRLLEDQVRGDLSVPGALLEVGTGRLYGTRELLAKTCRTLRSLMDPKKQMPRVVVVGEIYVRCDPFANDFTIDKLEERGIRCTFSPFSEWLEYADYINWKTGDSSGPLARVRSLVQARIQELCYGTAAAELGWGERLTVEDSLKAAASYISPDLHGEAVLTLGGPVHEWRHGQIDGVVSVGPLECMPNKICEAQFFHVAEQEGLPSLTLSLNGDPMDPEVLDNFAFEVHSRLAHKGASPEAEQQQSRLARKLWEALRPSSIEATHAALPFPVRPLIHVEDAPLPPPRLPLSLPSLAQQLRSTLSRVRPEER